MNNLTIESMINILHIYSMTLMYFTHNTVFWDGFSNISHIIRIRSMHFTHYVNAFYP